MFGEWCAINSLNHNTAVSENNTALRVPDVVMQVSHRDSQGNQLLRWQKPRDEGETLALLEAMREAIARGWSNIVIESDSKVIHSNKQGNSDWISLISSI
ncbi:hypothetical protein QL285_094653 [Trifolium repens]|nr:hypothetical protein QL285_094653 [Trifolium repens]